MLNWINHKKNILSNLSNNDYLNLSNKEYSTIKVIFEKKCEEIKEEIIKFANNKLFNDPDKIIELENEELRSEIFDIFNSNNNFSETFNEKVKLNIKDNLEIIKEILLNLINEQENELNQLINSENEIEEENNSKINNQINTLTHIFCDKLLLNITCILGYISSLEHSLWVNIISLLIVFEIRNCQYFTLSDKKNISEKIDNINYANRPSINIDYNKLTLSKNIEDAYLQLNSEEIYSNQFENIQNEEKNFNLIKVNNENNNNIFNKKENFIILSWLEQNNKEFFSLLLKYYVIIPINYKVGEVLKDISTLLNLSQGPGIIDKQINKTFSIPDPFRKKSFEIIKNLIYEQELFIKLIKLSGNQFFDISSDSISTLKCYLFISPIITSEYILQNQDIFFSNIFQYLIESKEYVPQRHGLRLLNQLLSIKEMSKVMTSFSNNYDYFKIFMKLITSNLNTTSYESFHIFKLFVANPNKSLKIKNNLLKNQNNIILFLNQFQNSRTDPQFISDKQVSYLFIYFIL